MPTRCAPRRGLKDCGVGAAPPTVEAGGGPRLGTHGQPGRRVSSRRAAVKETLQLDKIRDSTRRSYLFHGHFGLLLLLRGIKDMNDMIERHRDLLGD